MDEDRITQYAALLLSIDEIAYLCKVDVSKLRNQIRVKKGPWYEAYMAGKMKTKVAFRQLVLEFAKAGSPQAETLLNEYIEEQEGNE